MKRLQLAAAAFFLVMTPAMAADLLTKTPPPVTLWTGCYGGGNLGGVLADVNVQWIPNLAGFPISGADLGDFGSALFHTGGFTGGAQLGCNYQAGDYAFGIEADFGYTGIQGTRNISSPGVNEPSFSVSETVRSDFLSTVRGRLGLVTGPDGSWWFYATGGAAIAAVHFTDQGSFPLGEGGVNIASADQTQIGWTVGAGAEWAVAPGWSMKAEYLYVSFPSVNSTSTNTLNPVATIAHDHTLTENIGRIGLNWHFGIANY